MLVSTPIGNLGDIGARAGAALGAADLLLCEDTRVTATLLAHLGIARRAEALHEHNEEAMVPRVVARLREGATVALVSDAGTPLMSDPGFRLVRAAVAAGITVTAVPGPNAALMALTLSGLPPHPFLFLGFLPPKAGPRRAALARVAAAEQAGLAATLVLHEAPHRLAETLADAAAVLGARPAAVARELTKRFEEVRRGTLGELAAHYAAEVARGEITLVIGPGMRAEADEAELVALLRGALAGRSLRDAVAAVAEATGAKRAEVYRLALNVQKDT